MNRLLSNINFVNKVVLVTGASNGIGKEIAAQFAKLGANLSLTGRNKDRLEETFSQCNNIRQNDAQKIVRFDGDISNETDVQKLMEFTLKQFNRLDVVVNNAGIIEFGTIETTSLEQYDRVMNVNLRSIYHLLILAVPHLIETKGNVVNISSVNGIRSFPNVLAYNISKAGVDQLTRCSALELASKGVRVNAVNPGVIVSGLQKTGGLTDEQYANFLEHSKTTHALGRAGDVTEVAAAVTFLASDSASFITGISLPVDGGRHAMCPR